MLNTIKDKTQKLNLFKKKKKKKEKAKKFLKMIFPFIAFQLLNKKFWSGRKMQTRE